MLIEIYGQDQHVACGTLEEHDLASHHYTDETGGSVQIVGLNGQLRQPRLVEVSGQKAEHDPGPIPARDEIRSGCVFTTQDGGPISRSNSWLRYFFRGRVHQDGFLVFDLAEKGERYQSPPFLTTDLFLALWLGRKRLAVVMDSDIARLDTVLQWRADGDAWFDAGPWGKIDGVGAPSFFQQQFSMIDTMIEMMRHLERSLRRSLDRDFDVSEGLKRAARAFWEHTLLYTFLTELGYCDPRH